MGSVCTGFCDADNDLRGLNNLGVSVGGFINREFHGFILIVPPRLPPSLDVVPSLVVVRLRVMRVVVVRVLVVLAFLAFLGVGLLRPNSFSISRHISLDLFQCLPGYTGHPV